MNSLRTVRLKKHAPSLTTLNGRNLSKKTIKAIYSYINGVKEVSSSGFQHPSSEVISIQSSFQHPSGEVIRLYTVLCIPPVE